MAGKMAEQILTIEQTTALAESASWADRLVEFMQVGGSVVWVLTIFSIIALTIILAKLFQFYYLRAESADRVDKVLAGLQQGQADRGVAQLDEKRPIEHVVKMAIIGKLQNVDLHLLKEELERIATSRLDGLRAYLRPLEVIATLSPLLGLLGTVLGMIEAFQQMQAAGAQVDPSVLSGGIWKALLTTAVGLTVAIPVMLAFNWMERKVERVASLMNDAVTRVFTGSVQTQVMNQDVG